MAAARPLPDLPFPGLPPFCWPLFQGGVPVASEMETPLPAMRMEAVNSDAGAIGRDRPELEEVDPSRSTTRREDLGASVAGAAGSPEEEASGWIPVATKAW